MAGRVEHNPDGLLRLEVGEGGADVEGVGGRGVEVQHTDVEVLSGGLLAGLGRPDRRSPLLLVLEVQGRLDRPLGRTDLRPAVLRDDPAAAPPRSSPAVRATASRTQRAPSDPAPR
jgi:hypothetical protein